MSNLQISQSHLAGKPTSTVEFARLLESGDIHSAIAYRLDYLTHKIRSAREECEPPKVATLGVAAVAGLAGVTFSSPILMGLAAAGGVAYATSLSLQALQGGEIKPLPFSSQSLWAALGKVSDRSATGRTPLFQMSPQIANPAGYLDPIERAEYQILAGDLRFAECVFSSAQHPAARWGLWQLVARKLADGTIDEYFAISEAGDSRNLAPRFRSAEALLGNPERYSVTSIGLEVETWELSPVLPPKQQKQQKQQKRIEPEPEPITVDATAEASPWDAGEPAAEAAPIATLERTYEAAVQEEQELEERYALATTATEYLLANPAKSRAWYGGERSGKSYGAAQVSKQMEGVEIYHINLASFTPDGEIGEDEEYWGHAKRSFTFDLSEDCLTAEHAERIVGEAWAIFTEFRKSPGPSLLVFDEWVLLSAKGHEYADQLANLIRKIASLCTTYSTSGTKRNKAIWLISPKLVAGELTKEGLAIKGLPPCYIAIPQSQTVEWKGKTFVFDAELHEQLSANYGTLPKPAYDHEHQRKAYLGGSWYPLGW